MSHNKSDIVNSLINFVQKFTFTYIKIFPRVFLRLRDKYTKQINKNNPNNNNKTLF